MTFIGSKMKSDLSMHWCIGEKWVWVADCIGNKNCCIVTLMLRSAPIQSQLKGVHLEAAYLVVKHLEDWRQLVCFTNGLAEMVFLEFSFFIRYVKKLSVFEKCSNQSFVFF